jgi:predicted Fe-Mo cluster-binding NifX family protein
MLEDKGTVQKTKKIVDFSRRKAKGLGAAGVGAVAAGGWPNASPALSTEAVTVAPNRVVDLKRVAISMEGDYVSQHFRSCEKFCIVNIAEQQIISRQFVNNPVHIPDFMPEFLAIEYVDCVVTGGISEKEIEMLTANAIDVITGAKGSVEKVIASFIKGDLKTKNKEHTQLKIAIPVDDKSAETSVCMSFGRTPYFLIYDTETKEGIYLDTSAAANQGSAGIKAAQAVVDNQVGALLTPRCGENAAEVIKAADIRIYKTITGSARDNINAFIDGKLSLLEEIHAGFHNHGCI